MPDHSLEAAFCAVFRTDEDLREPDVFTALDGDTQRLPCVTVISRSEALSGSAEIFRSELEIRVESHAKDSTPQEHAARVARLLAFLGRRPEALAAINAAGTVQLLGYAFTGTTQETDDEKFVTSIALRVGYRLLAN